jgi:cyanophycin synthetase
MEIINIIIWFSIILVVIYLIFNNIVLDELPSCMHLNSKETCKLTLSKEDTNNFLKINNFPVPKSYVSNKNTINNSDIFYHDLSYPLVVKPSNGSLGIDVITGITSNKQLQNILKTLHKKYEKLIVEEQMTGTMYRLLYVNKKLISIIKRDIPYIIGNNKNTIKELVDEHNNNLPKNMYPIKINRLYILSQGYDIEHILEKNKKVFINNVLNYSGGALTYNYPIHKMNKENHKMFEDILSKFGSNCLGIDFISEDLSKPYYMNNGMIIEFNSNPSRKLHMVFDEEFKEKYMEKLKI